MRFLIGERGFRIHGISDNGNCLYDSVLFHLKCLGLYSNDSTSLRQDVADYLEVHRDLYADFICEALQVQPGNNYNCDTDAPSERDAMIASISDPVLRRLSLFNNYIRSTAWGDHIVIAALCNIFSITINVLAIHTDYQTTTVTTPCSASSQHEIDIALVLQYHYVALKRVDPPNEVQMGDEENPGEKKQSDESPEALTDEQIESGDQHTINISGGSTPSMLANENPESIVNVAPCEGRKPISIFSDKAFDPKKFPYGKGGFNNKFHKRLTHRMYFNQHLLDVDGRFVRDLDYLFAAQYIIEHKQVEGDANHYIMRRKPSRLFTASQARTPEVMQQFIHKDKAYRFLKNVRGSPPYYQRTFYELLAMIRQLGTPTWFFTLSAADMKWPDVIQIIAKQCGVVYTDEDV